MKLSFQRKVNTDKIHEELKESFAKYEYLNYFTEEETLELIFNNNLSISEQLQLNQILTKHDPDNQLEIARKKREQAQEFGQGLINSFIDENIILEIAQSGLSSHVRKVMREVNECLMSGSLYCAIDEIELIDEADLDEEILTSDRLLTYKNKIEEYLDIELSESYK